MEKMLCLFYFKKSKNMIQTQKRCVQFIEKLNDQMCQKCFWKMFSQWTMFHSLIDQLRLIANKDITWEYFILNNTSDSWHTQNI